MRDGKEVVYWDANIFLAWLLDEHRPDHEMDGVHECVRNVNAGRMIVITSAVTSGEIFQARLPKEVQDRFARLLMRRNVQQLELDVRIGVLSGEIRDYYLQRKAQNGGKIVTLADAQHLATAIHHKVDAFYTFDDGKKDKKSLGLLSLNGSVAGHPLRICRPPIGQYTLDLGV